MNVERLHAIAIAVKADLTATDSVGTVQRLQTALRNQVNAPQEAGYQQQVVEALTQLRTTLPDAESNTFSPSWLAFLEELNIAPLLGNALLNQVENVFAQNTITPSIAADEIKALADGLESLDGGLDQLLAGLEKFEIGSEQLEPGEAEVGVEIPRPAVQAGLVQLGEEFVELAMVLAPYSELAGKSRPPLTVSTIFSSDFGVLVSMAPEAAGFLALAVERVIAGYKTILEIRRLRQEASEQRLPESVLTGIDEHAKTQMEETIERTVSELLDRSEGIARTRQNELRKELRDSLAALARRIDEGYNIDVRAEPRGADATEGENGSGAEVDAAISEIRELSPNLQYLNRSGQPILRLLPAGADEPPESSSTDESEQSGPGAEPPER